jgi:hypothetical protein
MILQVTRIIYKNYDEDDEKLSEARATIVKREWVIFMPDVLCFGECYINKKYLEVWFTNGDSMYIDYPKEDFQNLFEQSKIDLTLHFEPEADEPKD